MTFMAPFIYKQNTLIDWSAAPEWANFYAIDIDGERWWFENKPQTQFNEYGCIYWESDIGEMEPAPGGVAAPEIWYNVHCRNYEAANNRIFDNGSYILTYSIDNDGDCFKVFKTTDDQEYIWLAEFRNDNDAVKYLFEAIYA